MKNQLFLLKIVLILSSLLVLKVAFSIPITSFGDKIYAQNNTTIEFAVLYEAAGYRHDLYYEFGDSQGYIATNHWGTGGAHGCGFCSYPSIYGTFTLDSQVVSDEITFRLEINNKGLRGALRTGPAYVNPDNIIHAWFANNEGLLLLDKRFALNIAHESFAIENLQNYYVNNKSINKLLSHKETRFIGFEDILRGGDLDYNDIIFAFRGVNAKPLQLRQSNSVPEPNSLILLLTSFFLLNIIKYLKKTLAMGTINY